eukprot:5677467-Prymnesium_polylepis.1
MRLLFVASERFDAMRAFKPASIPQSARAPAAPGRDARSLAVARPGRGRRTTSRRYDLGRRLPLHRRLGPLSPRRTGSAGRRVGMNGSVG